MEPFGKLALGRQRMAMGKQPRIACQRLGQCIAGLRVGIGGEAQRRIASGSSGNQLRSEIGQHPAHPGKDRVADQPLPVAGQQMAQHRHDRTERTGLAREFLPQDRLDDCAVSQVHRVFAHPARITRA